MDRSSRRRYQRRLSRRRVLGVAAGTAGLVGLSAALAGCAAPPAPTPVVKEVVKEVPKEVVREVVKEVPKEVVREVTKVVEREVVITPTVPASERWTAGKVSADTAGTFKLMSWEDEGEMRKFILHYERFFEKYYPKLKPQFDW